MTRSHGFKLAVRERMKKTGERYTAARAQLLAKRGAPTDTGTGYPFTPGLCSDTGAVRDFLEAGGVRLAGGRPLSEALVTGLAGGVGFLYIVFEYQGTPPLLSVLTRYDTAAERFAVGSFERLGLDVEVAETTSAAKARKTLDAHLDEGRPVLCVVDHVALKRSLAASELRGMVPTLVCATARDGDAYVVDAGSAEPLRVSADEFASARAAYKKGKHRTWVLKSGAELADVGSALRSAISDCATRYTVAPYSGYASNFGLAGMEKWARLLVDTKDKKGWPTLFPDGPRACLALRRAYQGLQLEMTPPAAGRGLHAEFLREAEELTGHAAYGDAASRYDEAAARWSDVAAAIAACEISEVRLGCDLLDAYAELLDERGEGAEELVLELRDSSQACELGADRAREIYADLATRVERAVESERASLEALESAVEVQR